MTRKKLFTFIVNPISGTSSKETIPQLIQEEIDSSQIQTEIIFTEYAGHARHLAAIKAEEGSHTIVAVGGDGTVNEIASALVHKSSALGIIPYGSGNGLARHLQIPLNICQSIQLLNHATIRRIDYGRINKKHLFFCSCGLGFDAHVSWKFSQASSRGFITYCNIALREKLFYQPEEYIVTIDDIKTFKVRAFVIACGNASEYGNDAYITPKASIEDGLLDVTLIHPITIFDVPILSYQLFNKTIDKNKKITTFRCRRIHITRATEGLVHFDGEPVLESSQIDIDIVPKGLQVIAPRFSSI